MAKNDNASSPLPSMRPQSALYQFVRDLARAPDVQTIADHVFARAKNLLGADYGFLGLANAEGTELSGVTSYGLDLDMVRQEHVQIASEAENGPVTLAFRKKAPVIVPHLPETSLWSERLRTRYPFVRDIWCAPLMNGEKAVGVLVLGYAAHRAATEDDIHLLQLLSDEAALAIERARLTEALQESEARYRRLVEDANDVICTFSIDGIVTGVNQATEILTGWTQEDLLGGHYSRFLNPDSSAIIAERVRKALRGDSITSTYEIATVRKDGSCVPVEVRGRFIRNQHNIPVGYQAIIRDITERRRIEDQIKEESEVQAAFACFGQEMLASLNTTAAVERLCQVATETLAGDYGYTMLWSPAEKAYKVVAGYGETAEQTEARRAFSVPPERFAHLFSYLEREGVIERSTEEIRDPIERSVMQRLRVATALYFPLYQGSKIIGVQRIWYRRGKQVAPRYKRIARGISHLASLALANAKLFEELVRANRIKEEFIGSVSHELRTPLNILLGYNEVLQDKTFGSLTTEQERILTRMNESARELLDLVTSTLDLSRLQNHYVPLALQDIHVPAFFADLATDVDQLERSSSLTLEWKAEASLPSLRTDAAKLRMILKNLLTNALKFTEVGSITVAACKQNDGMLFSVQDTGIGLSPEMLPFIFEPFRQVATVSTQNKKGVGLGLYIVRQLVTMLGGTIAVESALGKGSTFQVWLPLQND